MTIKELTQEEVITIFEIALMSLLDKDLFDQYADEMDLSHEAMLDLRDKLESYMNRKMG